MLKWVRSDLAPTIEAALGTCEVGPLPKAIGEASELYQLFLNLIGNAIKYRRPDVPPVVTVTADLAPEDLAEGTPWARIIVRNNGIGFDQAQAEKIFEPFERLVSTKEFEGSGIGLATVKKIVARHGGRIRATSNVGEGSTFIVDLKAWRHDKA
ncbi:MAG: hypothetical protein HC871_05855 [Rhizobiales bacterium]|nr:hypothetical protein [Hyphomicrobiales bacterium]